MNKSSWLNIALFTCSMYGFSSRWVSAQHSLAEATIFDSLGIDSLFNQNNHHWATVASMTLSLSNQALGDRTIATNLSLAMIEEVSQSHTIEALSALLANYESLRIISDAPIPPRLIIGILGDGTLSGTQLQIVEPERGCSYTQSFSQFSRQYEDVVYKEIAIGDELRLQIKQTNRSLLKHSISITLLSRIQNVAYE